ncbi:MAG: Hsp70 family protein, partial [Mycobacterium sp.]
MADETKPAIGMSVGASTLAAVTAERAVTCRPVLTLYRDRASQVGTPAENPNLNPDIGEPGLVITDFVDRVGDPTPVVATDGSTHRAEQLLADGLYALAYVATEGRPLPPVVAVTHPAHWSATAVEALRAALSRVPEWSQRQVPLISDVAAALTALQANPGLPADGIIAVCDFGGSGTSITLVDAARGHQPIGRTVRHTDFSGDAIDQALLNHVVASLTADGSLDGTLAIGSLTRLRGQCRNAKEQLSANTVTELAVDLPGFHGGVWVTRAELDEAIRQPLDGFLAAIRETLDRSGIQATDLAAVASVGGGANIPTITSGLSQHLGVAVISSPRPHLTAAIGAALGAAHSPAGTAETAAAPTAPAPTPTADDAARLEAPPPVPDTPA